MSRRLLMGANVGVAWTPAAISTALWLDAADASTISTVSGGVSEWRDKSGNGRHATQGTSTFRPAVTQNAQNGLSVINFNPPLSGYQYLTFARIVNLQHIFFVAKKNDLNDSSTILSDATAFDLRCVFFGDDSTIPSVFRMQQLSPTLSTATRNVWHLAEILADGSNATLGIDGGRTSAADADLMSSNAIGWYNNSPEYTRQYSFRGQIGEILMSFSPLSTSERQKLEGYLAHKWGLLANLPADHPYKLSPPIS